MSRARISVALNEKSDPDPDMQHSDPDMQHSDRVSFHLLPYKKVKKSLNYRYSLISVAEPTLFIFGSGSSHSHLLPLKTVL